MEIKDRLISVDYAIHQLEIGEFDRGGIFETDSSRMKDFLNAIPTIEIVHAHWEYDERTSFWGNPYRCSACKKANDVQSKYCPNCGAKMMD